MNEQFEHEQFEHEQFEQGQFEQEQFEQEQFELLPFAGEGELESELESERGARRSAPARAPAAKRAGPRNMPSGPRVSGPRPSGPRPSRPRPFGPWPFGPWPYYGGGWPYPVAVGAPAQSAFEPQPPPRSAPEPEPDPAEPADPGAADDAPFDQPEAEVPPTLSGTLTRLPAGQRPAYLALGAVTTAISDPRSAAPGLYLIEFTSNGQRRAYSGQSSNVRKRLQQHLLCARMLGLSLTGHQVYVAPLPSLGPAQRRAMEQRIHTDMFARSGGVLTNQRRELELSLLGPQWA
ncbi:MAG: GIY-YIG nuclease family protein [Massilia sp.]|nr:GIY-YIG nuclease family protein [Massilia sp.]